MDIDYGDVFFGALIALILAEGTAWVPNLSRRIIRLAARRLSFDLRDRLEEEWLRHFEDTPGTLSPFVVACQCLLASIKIVPIRKSFDLRSRSGRIKRVLDPSQSIMQLPSQKAKLDGVHSVQSLKPLSWWTRLAWITVIAIGVALAFGAAVNVFEIFNSFIRG